MDRWLVTLILVFAVASADALAGRVVRQTLFPSEFVYLTGQNVGSVDQTVDTIFRASGGITLLFTTNCAGHLGTECPSPNECRNKSTLRVLRPGEAVTICARVAGSTAATTPSTAVISAEFVVEQDRGAVAGSGAFQIVTPGTNLVVPLLINAGRPF